MTHSDSPPPTLREEIIEGIFERSKFHYIDLSYDELEKQQDEWTDKLLALIEREKRKAFDAGWKAAADSYIQP